MKRGLEYWYWRRMVERMGVGVVAGGVLWLLQHC